ncbi:MAG: RluA family pseudouridine synthase, partial [Desulfohalobiaceae bacterium]
VSLEAANMPGVQYLEVSPEESGQKLLAFLQRRLQQSIPRSALMRWVRTGQVRLDHSRCKPFVRLHQGQVVRIPPHRIQAQELRALQENNPFYLRKVFEDHRLLVLAKPPDLAVQPGSNLADSVVHRIRHMYQSSPWMPALVHRLDKQTSGLLLLAKEYAYLQHLQGLWKAGRVRKVYLAWVGQKTSWSSWNRLQDQLQTAADKKKDRQKQEQTAVSYVRTLCNTSRGSLLAVQLLTGRKHQIRLQLAHRGLPLLGDRRYQGTASGQGLLLHACHLSWPDYAFNLEPPWVREFSVPSLQGLGLDRELPGLG